VIAAYQDAVWLKEKYIGQHLTTQEIAESLGCNSGTIWYWLKKHGIPTRSKAEANCGSGIYTNREWLEEQYCIKRLSARKIAKLAGCASKTTILRWMKRFEIPRRTMAEAKKPTHEIANAESLRALYWDEKLSAKQIALRYDLDSTCILSWMKMFDVPRRTPGDGVLLRYEDETYRRERLIKAPRGTDHYNWHGGFDYKGYPTIFGENFKEGVRQRDGYTCAVCRFAGKDVHHINYIKEDTVPENCITLCRQCHGKTHYNRIYWQIALNNLIIKRIVAYRGA